LRFTLLKGHEYADSYWTDDDMAMLEHELVNYDVTFLNPALRSDDLSDQRSVFGRDMLQVYCSNIVFVDARHKRGLGVGAEMMWAKLNSIPVVTLAPKNTHYNKSETSLLGVPVSNWIHPFVESLSDKVVENLAEGAQWIIQALSNSATRIKSIEYLHEAMQYYHDHQLTFDIPMQESLISNIDLSIRVNCILTPTTGI
jgi:hypothetical protein